MWPGEDERAFLERTDSTNQQGRCFSTVHTLSFTLHILSLTRFNKADVCPGKERKDKRQQRESIEFIYSSLEDKKEGLVPLTLSGVVVLMVIEDIFRKYFL